VTLELSVGVDANVVLSVGDVRVVGGDFERVVKPQRSLRGRFNRVTRADQLSVAELRLRNLPLYWNREWLKEQLAVHGSYSEVARVHGYPSATTIASYAKRRHGFDLQAVFDAKRLAVLAEHEARRGTDDPATHVDLARRHGVAVATVYRWLREDREGLTPDPCRTHKRHGRGAARKRR
jgi:hypothetical protein